MSLKFVLLLFEYLWKRIWIRKSLKWKCRKCLFDEINWSGDICWHFTQLSIKHQPFYSTCLFLILENKTIVEETKAIAHNAHNNHQHQHRHLKNNTKIYNENYTNVFVENIWKVLDVFRMEIMPVLDEDHLNCDLKEYFNEKASNLRD